MGEARNFKFSVQIGTDECYSAYVYMIDCPGRRCLGSLDLFLILRELVMSLERYKIET